jgi:hypothetical protein
MQLTLQATTGPHTGRKVLLRSGQIARIGRTEWADFSFPRDSELAEVHFAVQCQLHGARVRKLAADKPLAVNAKDVTEAELVSGDTINAGQTNFLVTLDGQASGSASAAQAGAATATLAGSASGGNQPSTDEKAAKREPTALEIAEQLQMSDEVKALAATLKTGPELVVALAKQKQFAKAVRVQAHLLLKTECVWWGWLCVEQAGGSKLAAPEATAHQAARAWIEDPTEINRRQCESDAAKTKYDGAGSWLAMGAFWSGGSLAPADVPDVVPDDKLTGQAVTSSLMIAAVSGPANQIEERYRKFLATALEVAAGKPPLPKKREQ